MTDEAIVQILKDANAGKSENVIMGPISKDVFFGYAYEKIEAGKPVPLEGYAIFLVKASDGKFGGAVQWLGDYDIHWLVLPTYRRQGLLVNSLRKVILPAVFELNSEMIAQTATINRSLPDAEHSARLAEKVGFQLAESNEEKLTYLLPREKIRASKRKRKKSDQKTVLALQRQLAIQVRQFIWMVDRFEIEQWGKLKPAKLCDLRRRLRSVLIDFDDVMWDELPPRF